MWQWYSIYLFVFIVAAAVISETEPFIYCALSSAAPEDAVPQQDAFCIPTFLNKMAYSTCAAAIAAASLLFFGQQRQNKRAALPPSPPKPTLPCKFGGNGEDSISDLLTGLGLGDIIKTLSTMEAR